ncbi:hypothetical protein F5887DRAFT_982136, partial [Amanita rubescens]
MIPIGSILRSILLSMTLNSDSPVSSFSLGKRKRRSAFRIFDLRADAWTEKNVPNPSWHLAAALCRLEHLIGF